MRYLLLPFVILSLAFMPQSIIPNKSVLSPKQKGEAASHPRIVPTALLSSTSLPAPPTNTLVWFPVTNGVSGINGTVGESVAVVTNYEIWSTPDGIMPRQFEASTQGTNFVFPILTMKLFSVRSVNSLGLKSQL